MLVIFLRIIRNNMLIINEYIPEIFQMNEYLSNKAKGEIIFHPSLCLCQISIAMTAVPNVGIEKSIAAGPPDK